MVASNFLREILEHKQKLVLQKKNHFGSLKEKIDKGQNSRYHIFKNAISCPGKIHLIAEIKKASPSRGLICKQFDVQKIARTYVENGASAISVLTEEKFFLGKPIYLADVSDHFSIPVLTKDFIVDEGQVYEAYSFGASAVLLIMAILTDQQFRHLHQVASQLDLDCLVEVHDEIELDRALQQGAQIIGINNRDLHSFTVDLKVSERLIPKIPQDKIIVVESGISSHREVKMFEEMGANAVLIGEAFLSCADIGKKVKEVMLGEK